MAAIKRRDLVIVVALALGVYGYTIFVIDRHHWAATKHIDSPLRTTSKDEESVTIQNLVKRLDAQHRELDQQRKMMEKVGIVGIEVTVSVRTDCEIPANRDGPGETLIELSDGKTTAISAKTAGSVCFFVGASGSKAPLLYELEGKGVQVRSCKREIPPGGVILRSLSPGAWSLHVCQYFNQVMIQKAVYDMGKPNPNVTAPQIPDPSLDLDPDPRV